MRGKSASKIWSAFCQCLFLFLHSGLCGRQPKVCESKTNWDRTWCVSVLLILYLFKAHTCCLIHKCLQAKRTLVLWNLCTEFSLSSYSFLLLPSCCLFYSLPSVFGGKCSRVEISVHWFILHVVGHTSGFFCSMVSTRVIQILSVTWIKNMDSPLLGPPASPYFAGLW